MSRKAVPILSAMLMSITLLFSGCFLTVEEEVTESSSKASSSKTVSSEISVSSQTGTESEEAASSEVSSNKETESSVNESSEESKTPVSSNTEKTESKKETAEFNGTEAHNAVFYIDNINGNDANSGKSPKTAWKSVQKVNSSEFAPGTKILFKSGGVWYQPLSPKSSGAPGKHIVIDKYGTGPKPVINGDGEYAGIRLSNLQYIEVRNLKVTNPSEYASERIGVSVIAGGQSAPGEYRDGGVFKGIYLVNLDIDEVDGEDGNRWNGGIVFLSYYAKTPVAFEDVRVEGCSVKNVEGNGITFASEYNSRVGVEWGKGEYFPSKNVTFRNNYISAVSGDGLFMNCIDYLTAEYNVVTNTAYTATGQYAGLWPHNSNHITVQYNEVYDTKLAGGDGQGIDVDINCENTLVQYNYSHDNEGGFMLICIDGHTNGFNRDVTVRYNISENDKDALFTLSGPISDIKVYNNTFYVKEGLKTRLIGSYIWATSGKGPLDARFTNNIFYMNSTGADYFHKKDNVIFDSNLFYGSYNFSNLPAVNSVTSNPLFVNPNSGGVGRNTVTGYKLKANSPAINAGKRLTDRGATDFFGVPLPENKADLGAAVY